MVAVNPRLSKSYSRVLNVLWPIIAIARTQESRVCNYTATCANYIDTDYIKPLKLAIAESIDPRGGTPYSNGNIGNGVRMSRGCD